MRYLEELEHHSGWVKNERKYRRFGQKEFLDRGDFKVVDAIASVPGGSTIYLRQTDCSTCAAYSRQSNKSNRVPKKNNNRCSIKKGTARLKCTEGTFRVHKIYGDGNCMFRAVSYILWQNEDEHRHLRTMVVQHIKESWYEYGPFVMAEWNISDRQEYCDYMSMVGTYASELECTVATKICHMNLSIYRKVNGSYEVKRVFHNRVNPEYEIARLLFTGNSDSGHYDVLFPD